MVFPHNINFTFLEKICQYFQMPNRFTYYCIIRHNLIYIGKKEHIFYSLGIDTWLRIFSIGGVFVNEKEDYRKMIIEMVKNVKSCDILVYIYKLTLDIIKEDKEDE